MHTQMLYESIMDISESIAYHIVESLRECQNTIQMQMRHTKANKPKKNKQNKANNQKKRQQPEKKHPEEYSELYNYWNRLKCALTNAEIDEIFKLCEATGNYKVETKIKHAMLYLSRIGTSKLKAAEKAIKEREEQEQKEKEQTRKVSKQAVTKPKEKEVIEISETPGLRRMSTERLTKTPPNPEVKEKENKTITQENQNNGNPKTQTQEKRTPIIRPKKQTQRKSPESSSEEEEPKVFTQKDCQYNHLRNVSLRRGPP